MAHATVEWTDNLVADGFEIRPMLEVIAATMRDADGVFPIGGIRVRGHRLTDYVIADDAGCDAFVNIDVKMGAGRSAEVRHAVMSRLFDAILAHLGDLPQRRPLAVSLYVEEAGEDASWKFNTIHDRLKKAR
jgi:5-carboxymethyl-2-hydroxymuconate isomerase